MPENEMSCITILHRLKSKRASELANEHCEQMGERTSDGPFCLSQFRALVNSYVVQAKLDVQVSCEKG